MPNSNTYDGFIYIWRDSSNGKFYIGSHLGRVDDGYIGSGKYFKVAYNKRPECFKRRIIEYVSIPYIMIDRKIRMLYMFSKEQRWLDLIRLEELTVKYYNLKRRAFGHTAAVTFGRRLSEESKEKIRKARLGSKASEASKIKRSLTTKGRPGKPPSKETRDKMSAAAKRRQMTDERKQKISQTLTGIKRTDEQKLRYAEAARRRPPMTDEHRRNLSIAQKNRPPLTEEQRENKRLAQKRRRERELLQKEGSQL